MSDHELPENPIAQTTRRVMARIAEETGREPRHLLEHVEKQLSDGLPAAALESACVWAVAHAVPVPPALAADVGAAAVRAALREQWPRPLADLLADAGTAARLPGARALARQAYAVHPGLRLLSGRSRNGDDDGSRPEAFDGLFASMPADAAAEAIALAFAEIALQRDSALLPVMPSVQLEVCRGRCDIAAEILSGECSFRGVELPSALVDALLRSPELLGIDPPTERSSPLRRLRAAVRRQPMSESHDSWSPTTAIARRTGAASPLPFPEGRPLLSFRPPRMPASRNRPLSRPGCSISSPAVRRTLPTRPAPNGPNVPNRPNAKGSR